jgi:hypothetical protein
LFDARDAVDIPVYTWDIDTLGLDRENFLELDENGAKVGKVRHRVEYVERLSRFLYYRDGLKAGYIK